MKSHSFAAQHVQLPPSSVAYGKAPVTRLKVCAEVLATLFAPPKPPSAHQPAASAGCSSLGGHSRPARGQSKGGAAGQKTKTGRDEDGSGGPPRGAGASRTGAKNGVGCMWAASWLNHGSGLHPRAKPQVTKLLQWEERGASGKSSSVTGHVE